MKPLKKCTEVRYQRACIPRNRHRKGERLYYQAEYKEMSDSCQDKIINLVASPGNVLTGHASLFYTGGVWLAERTMVLLPPYFTILVQTLDPDISGGHSSKKYLPVSLRHNPF